MIPVPDLLHSEPQLALDGKALGELLEVGFLGGAHGPTLEKALAPPHLAPSSWKREFFVEELFLDDLIEECMTVTVNGKKMPVNRVFLREVLAQPPGDVETIHFRQGILRELETDPEISAITHELYGQLFHLLSLFKAPHKGAKLDLTMFRIEILEHARNTVDYMADQFSTAKSALGRISESAQAIQASDEYAYLNALLDFDNHLSRLSFQLRVGADGKIRNLELKKVEENVKNPFYRGPWKRLWDRFELSRRGYEFSNRELVNRVVQEVFQEISDWLKPILQLLGHLAFYLSALSFRERCLSQGLDVAMATFPEGGPMQIDQLFNPLLLRQGSPVPCSIGGTSPDSIIVITGPNSGGKTRLLQAVGVAQLLGQAGLYVPAARAQLAVVDGLFASSTEQTSVDQREGRLGTELVRIRTLFESIGSRSMVLMDELCSGTNPSEAVEIFLIVLELLSNLNPVAIITTHFLDFGRKLEQDPPVPSLEFLQVEMEGERSTYQFAPGVAPTSLATSTARRLGVTLDKLSALVERHGGTPEPDQALIREPDPK
jgi:DNA mismatch repair protein MutS2